MKIMSTELRNRQKCINANLDFLFPIVYSAPLSKNFVANFGLAGSGTKGFSCKSYERHT